MSDTPAGTEFFATSTRPRPEDAATTEEWPASAVDLLWIMRRAVYREDVRTVRQTIRLVGWRDGYPKWVISDE